jgi:CubicO group peptidase (beta-lactamase class C family)
MLWLSASPLLLALAASPAPSQPLDARELEAFLDGVIAAQVEAHPIAGATVSVVKEGKLFFAKGYGFADIEGKRPVDPERTLFRVGSVSKLFTWTAVMQLYQEGKLDLDADLNTYLETPQIPPAYSEPITLAHLLTHTPGFEDRGIGLFARSADRLRPLADLLAAELPNRVRPPGQLASYSNHGTALAGLVVARVSGRLLRDEPG